MVATEHTVELWLENSSSRETRKLASKLSFFSKTNPSVLDHMDQSARQSVTTSSVLLKSSTQLYSIQLHCIK
jgi:hypothetical protein